MEKELLFGHSNVVVIRLHITANNMDEKQTQSVTKKKDSIFMATLKPFKKLGAVLRSRWKGSRGFPIGPPLFSHHRTTKSHK